VSTAFYFADKAFIDSVVRLKDLYQVAEKDPFPIAYGAYPSVTAEQVADGKIVYGLSTYCSYPDGMKDNYRAVDRLHSFWEQALLRRLGHGKNVNGERILILFRDYDYDYECVYPA